MFKAKKNPWVHENCIILLASATTELTNKTAL